MPAISVFVSYARADDEATYGRITKLKSDIQTAYTALSGESVGVFQDTESISLGEKWKDRIRAGLTSSSILLAFVSPAFLRSAACREELREFLGFLQTGGNLRLIIPLIFGDADRLSALFAEDDLWQELSKVQRLPISELRTADPGTSLWLTNVERIAQRIDEVLAEAEQRGPESSKPQSIERELSPDGPMEVFAEFEVAAPRFTENLERFLGVFSSLEDVIGSEGESMKRAATFSQRLAVTKRLASKLQPVATESAALSAELKENTQSFDKAVRTAVQLTRSGLIDADSPETVSGFEAVRGLATTGLDALGSVDVLTSAIDSGMGLSAALDRPLKQMKSAFLVFAEMRGVFRAWIDELDSLTT